MVKVSVIVPVYNMEKYLSQCLDSIVNQTLTDIEIITINDGSSDNSLNILNEYADKDSRMQIVTQKNHGLGATRNKGLKLAKGEYVYFMDADDYLELTALEETYQIAKKYNADFVMFKLNNFYEDTKEIIDDDYFNMPELKNRVGNNVFKYEDVSDIALDLAVNAPGCLFKREFIEDIKFPEGLLFEDNVFFTNALFKAEKIYFYDKFLYNRRRRSNSLSRPTSIKSLDRIEITNLLLDLINKFNHPQHKKILYYRIFINIYQIFENTPEEDKEDLFLEIKTRYLKYKEKWENDDYFVNNLNSRYKNIFESAITSDSAKEFELRVKLFDIKQKNLKLKKENQQYKNKINNIKKENKMNKSTKVFKLLKERFL